MLLDLPYDLLAAVADCLSERDIGRLERTSRALFDLLDPILYRRNVERSDASALRWAARNGQTVAVRKALELGADSNGGDLTESPPWTPLGRASEYGYVEIVRLLLRTGSVNVNWDAKGRGTALDLAAKSGHTDVVRELLGADGIDPDYRGPGRYTALMHAAQAGHADIVELLVGSGKVDPGAKGYLGRTPISLAAEAGKTSVVSILLRSGRASADEKDFGERTALNFAASLGHASAVRVLLESGVEADLPNTWGWTPLINAARAEWSDRNPEVVELLLRSGRVDVDHQDNGGQTALMHAVHKAYAEGVRLLLNLGGADPGKRDSSGHTPLHCAALVSHRLTDDLVGDLIANNTINDIVDQLLLSERGCDAGARDNKGATPLLYAAENNWLGIGERLLERGSKDVHVKDNSGLSPLDLAIRGGHKDFVKLLQRSVGAGSGSG